MKHGEMSSAEATLRPAPEPRAERLEEVRKRLLAGVYETRAVRQELAYRLCELRGVLGTLAVISGPPFDEPAKNR